MLVELEDPYILLHDKKLPGVQAILGCELEAHGPCEVEHVAHDAVEARDQR